MKVTEQDFGIVKETMVGLRDAPEHSQSIADIYSITIIDDQYLDEEITEIFGDENTVETIRILGAMLEDRKIPIGKKTILNYSNLLLI